MKQTQVALLTVGLFVGLVALAPLARGATATVSTIAERDAGVYSYWPNQNNGTDDFFVAGNWSILGLCEAYFSFPLGDKPANFTKAEIRIYYFAVNDASAISITASLITEAWGEIAITWNTRPAHGPVIDIISCIKTGETIQDSWITLDVTNLIQSGQTRISLCLNATNSVQLGWIMGYTREIQFESNRPTLVWTYPTAELPPATPGEGGIPGYDVFLLILAATGIVLVVVWWKKKQPVKTEGDVKSG